MADAATPHIVRLADYRPPEFLVDTVDLVFDLDPDATRVSSRLAVRRNPANDTGNAALFLNGEDIKLKGLRVDGVALGANQHRLVDGNLVVPDLPDACVIEIETEIAPAANTELSGLYQSKGSYFSQCEAEGFRRITFFPDRPDVMAKFTVTIRAERAGVPVLLSNGNLSGAGDLGNGRHFATWIDPHPKPCYLFAIVAGDLVAVKDSFTTMSGRVVELGIWVRAGDEGRCGHAMASLKKSMKWDEEVFGLEYDLDVFNIAAVSDFNMGAMENKGLNVFNTKYVLADPASATDGDYQGIEAVIAHEYFHNWTGNRVTCRDWFQLSLKEGLTVFRDQEFSADQGSGAVKRIGDVRGLRAGQFREDAGPLAHPVQPDEYMAIDNFYTATIYQKGAEVIRMMRTIIGSEAFRAGMDLYFERHDNQAVTIDDFAQAMQDASGIDLTAFKRWYHQAGTPEIFVSDRYDPAARRYTLTLRQTTPATPEQPEKTPLVIPVAMALLATDGAALTDTRVLMLSEAEQDFVFDGIENQPTPSLLRGFSAPVKLSGLSRERLALLAAHDADPFVAWESGQQFATGVLLEMAAANRRGESPALDAGVITAIRKTLAGAGRDPAFAAEAISLPGEAFLADQMAVIDVEEIHWARQSARCAIGEALGAELLETYQRLSDPGEYRIDGASIGRRALRNSCLGYLVAAGGEDGVRLARAQFDAADNMTDVLAAFSTLNGVDCPERTEVLAAFHGKWRGDDLVMDKWFAIQAMSPLPGTIEAVRALKAHTDFDLRNPNRVRAVLGGFSAGNQLHFHDASGDGYRLLGETIRQLDPVNGQIAARLVSPLGQWRRVDPARQALMRTELSEILALKDLSRGTFEMASRSLA